MQHLLNYSPAELESWAETQGQGKFRGRQLAHWLFHRRAERFGEMTDLPQSWRTQLEAETRLWTGEAIRHLRSPDGTEKLLLQWPDGQAIECVLLRDGERRTICISTQVGCAMGCVFCASGIGGVVRNLSQGEIVEQMLRLQRLLPAEERLSHIVVMGMGEPLANLEALLGALDVAHADAGLGISARRITISTVGLPAAVRRLAERQMQYHLAVSLHAPDDQLRNQLVPVNRQIGLAAVLEAADQFFEATGRRVTYEYVMLGGVNDRPQHARRLADLLDMRQALVNLIPYNPVAELGYTTPTQADVRRFAQLLEGRGLNVQVRERKGDRINAACGQLRRAAAGGSSSCSGGAEASATDLVAIQPSSRSGETTSPSSSA